MLKQKQITKPFGSFFILLAALLLTFSQCKSDKTSNANEVRIALSGDPTILNPTTYSSAYDKQVWEEIFMPLVDFSPANNELSPVLAKQLPVISAIDTGAFKGGTAFEYEIINEAVWDNGTPVTAKDYAFTIKTILIPQVKAAKLRGAVEFIDDVILDANNPKKFTVLTKERYIHAEENAGNIYILPEYVYDPNGLVKDVTVRSLSDTTKVKQLVKENTNLQKFADEFNSNKFAREKGFVVGCGAYELTEWVNDQRLVLTKKKNWFGDKLAAQNPMLVANPERLIYRNIKDANAQMAELASGNLDVISSIPAANFKEMEANDKIKSTFNLTTSTGNTTTYIYLNTNNPKLQDKKVRQALAHLVNSDEIIKTIFNGSAEKLAGPYHPTKPYNDKSITPVNYDATEAKKLLEAAGWKDSNNNGIVDKKIGNKLVEMDLKLLLVNKTPGPEMGLLIKNSAKAAGVNIEIVPKEFKLLKEDAKKRDFDMYIGGNTSGTSLDDPYQRWHTDTNKAEGDNTTGFGNAATDKLIDDIRSTLNKSERDGLYKQFHKIFMDELPAIPLYAKKECIAINKRFSEAKVVNLYPGYVEQQFKVK